MIAEEKLVKDTTVIISCPFDGLPMNTSLDNQILSRSPLTLAMPVRCPYSPHESSIKDGNIMNA